MNKIVDAMHRLGDAAARPPGRPPRAGGPRRDVIVTLDDDERALIDAACEATGQMRAVAIREAALRWARSTQRQARRAVKRR